MATSGAMPTGISGEFPPEAVCRLFKCTTANADIPSTAQVRYRLALAHVEQDMANAWPVDFEPIVRPSAGSVWALLFTDGWEPL